MWHKTLERQISKHLFGVDISSEKMTSFLESVSRTYADHEQDRELIERSLDISSKELVAINEKMAKEASMLHEKSEELERFNKLMIGREIKMIELKKQIRTLQNALKQIKSKP